MVHRAADALAAPTPCVACGGLWVSGDPGGVTSQQAQAPEPIPAAPAPTPSQPLSPSLSSLHMRGGLGKTLLIAFLLLAIVPLSFLALVTYHQVQQDIRQRLLSSLETVASLQEAHLMDWAEANRRDLALVAAALERSDAAAVVAIQAELEDQLLALRPAYGSLVLADAGTGRVLAAAPSGSAFEPGSRIDPRLLLGAEPIILPAGSGQDDDLQESGATGAAVRYPWDGKLLVGMLRWEALCEVVANPGLAVEGMEVYLVTPGGLVFDATASEPAAGAAPRASAALREVAAGPSSADDAAAPGVQALLRKESGAGAYQGLQGVPVFGAYRWVPALELGILTEQAQARFLSGGDALTALIVGGTLAVALLTAAIAAVVTRRITRPIVQLTATASWMARGDLSRRVKVTRRDEIGVLAGAFNRMAAELQILYANLEARVAERTAQLADANDQARHQARQLAISADVARVASSIRDLPALLGTVVELIGRSFELDQASIYLLCREVPSAVGPGAARATVDGQGASLALWQARVADNRTLHGAPAASVPAIVQAALAGGQAPAMEGEGLPLPGSSPAGQGEVAVPLQVCGRTLGVLHIAGANLLAYGESDRVIYRSLADQIAIAIENASAYALEHETVRHLRELDRIQSQFLTNMSHALRTPLNSVIGFSRVMLKGLDGSLNELQRGDLATIHEGGRQLLGLIDDLLELSQWDIAPFAADGVLLPGEGEGHVPALNEGPVDLAEIVEGVMATIRALARGKPVRLSHQVPGDLPRITTDGRLLRRLILALLANAVKFTGKGQIRLAVSALPGALRVSVSVGPGQEPALAAASHLAPAPPGEQDRRDGPAHPWMTPEQAAIARGIVEQLGGQVWPESALAGREEDGIAFAFTLPVAGPEARGSSSSTIEEAQ